MQGLFCCLSTKISFFTVSRLFFACLAVRIEDNEENSLKVALKKTWQEFPLIHVGDELPHL